MSSDLRGVKTGFHIEHVLSNNSQNIGLFEGDEERFEQERNRLGGVLLLKAKDNISVKNEVFANKLKSFANTLPWNETLRADSYKSKIDFQRYIAAHGFGFRAMDQFGPESGAALRKLSPRCPLISAPKKESIRATKGREFCGRNQNWRTGRG